MLKLRKEISYLKQVLSEGEAVPMWYGVAWVEPIYGKAVCYPFGIHIVVRWAYLLYYSLMAPRRTWWELKLRAVRDEAFEAGVKFGERHPDFDGVFVFNRGQVNQRIAAAFDRANAIARMPQDVAYEQGHRIGSAETRALMERRARDNYATMGERTKEIRTRHGDEDRPWWPTYREDPDWGPTPGDLTENDALDAIMDALNQEGVNAWNGDATSICAQMLYQQYAKRKEAEAEIERATNREK